MHNGKSYHRGTSHGTHPSGNAASIISMLANLKTAFLGDGNHDGIKKLVL